MAALNPCSPSAACPCRYTSSWLAAEKLRDEEWWQGTLRPLRQLEAAATLAAGAGDGGSPAGAAASAGAGAAPLGPVAAAAAKKRQKKGAAVEQAAAKLLAEREDAELAQRVQQVRVRTGLAHMPTLQIMHPPHPAAARKYLPNAHLAPFTGKLTIHQIKCITYQTQCVASPAAGAPRAAQHPGGLQGPRGVCAGQAHWEVPGGAPGGTEVRQPQVWGMVGVCGVWDVGGEVAGGW
jgi:hypothetical protein